MRQLGEPWGKEIVNTAEDEVRTDWVMGGNPGAIQALAADLVQYPFGAIRLEERTTRVQAFIVNWMLDHNVSIKDDQSPKDKIIIEVSGGVVQSIDNIPQDVVVEVHDYDVEGEDETELETDAHGDNYRCGVWEN